jgi:hypothetical protein
VNKENIFYFLVAAQFKNLYSATNVRATELYGEVIKVEKQLEKFDSSVRPYVLLYLHRVSEGRLRGGGRREPLAPSALHTCTKRKDRRNRISRIPANS